MNRKKETKKIISPFAIVSAAVLVLMLALLALARIYPAVADAVNSYIASPLRRAAAALTYVFPISLFEVALLSLLPFAVGIVVLAVRSRAAVKEKLRALVSGVAVVALFYSWYVAVMAIPYNTTALASRLGINESENISVSELYSVTLEVRNRVNELSPAVSREGGVGVMPYDIDGASEKICEAYDKLRSEYSFFESFTSRAKPIFFSDIMSDMGITGIYTYLTGEANINTSFPDYCTVFTIAHEFAHQRGINPENEANFTAFLVLSYSDDAFLQYSAYLNLYEYLASALYSADKELYFELREGLVPDAQSDISASGAVTKAHRDSPLYKLMHNVNDAYLKSNGTDGVVSYGYVVRLAVAYFKG